MINLHRQIAFSTIQKYPERLDVYFYCVTDFCKAYMTEEANQENFLF